MSSQAQTVYLFDFDGTLTSVELLPLIASELGIEREIAELTEATMAGEVPFEKSLRERVELLRSVPVETVSRIVEEVPVFTRLLDWITDRRRQCVIVTGNLDCWIDGWMQKHGLDYFASHARVGRDGVEIRSILSKETVLRRYAGVRTVMVGDGANDAQAIADADVGIGAALVHNPAPVVIEVADWVIMDEEVLCTTLSRL